MLKANQPVRAVILVNGRPVKQYNHEGRTYIEGKSGTEYVIRVFNDSSKRVAAAVSVDGIDVVTGKPAKADSQGYVVNAHSYVDIKGFRASDSVVGAFKFANKNGSYAATKGKAALQNVGVIGVLAHEEYLPPQPIYYDSMEIEKECSSGDSDSPSYNPPYTTYCMNTVDHQTRGPSRGASRQFCGSLGVASASAPVAKGLAPKFDMGTTWGTQINEKVTTVSFQRGDQLPEYTLYYASRAGLLEAGIINEAVAVETFPQAFSQKWASPPAGWP